jgi:hypothetical protein
MFGPLTVGKKAAKAGYKRFGLPGAIAAGTAGAGGYVIARKKLKSAATSDETDGSAGEEATSSDATSADAGGTESDGT